jgi:hypothetical protein
MLVKADSVDSGLTVKKFTDRELTAMAEKEHGRFVIERLTKGWTSGARNNELKKSPYLIPWDQIDDPVIKQYDIDIVSSYPAIFNDIGYWIVKKK